MGVRSHLWKMLVRVCLVLSLFICHGLNAPSGLKWTEGRLCRSLEYGLPPPFEGPLPELCPRVTSATLVSQVNSFGTQGPRRPLRPCRPCRGRSCRGRRCPPDEEVKQKVKRPRRQRQQ